MSLTRIDCDFYKTQRERKRMASYVALNPNGKAGSLVFAGATAVRSSIGAQVACRLSLDHYVEGVLNYFGEENRAALNQAEVSQHVLEAAFKQANTSVYNFGHKLAAGGRMAATLFGLVVEDSCIAAGRVGEWSAYLLREGMLYPFFDEVNKTASNTTDHYVGAKSLITVETANVPGQEGDVIILFSDVLDASQLRLLSLIAEDFKFKPNVALDLFEDLLAEDDNAAMSMVAVLGPDSIYLTRPIE